MDAGLAKADDRVRPPGEDAHAYRLAARSHETLRRPGCVVGDDGDMRDR
jgi:hypothetical protein